MIDFEKFFAGEFQRLLERASIPGMGEASWDRRAAWLLWRAMHPKAPTVLEFDRATPDSPFEMVSAQPETTGGIFD